MRITLENTAVHSMKTRAFISNSTVAAVYTRKLEQAKEGEREGRIRAYETFCMYLHA